MKRYLSAIITLCLLCMVLSGCTATVDKALTASPSAKTPQEKQVLVGNIPVRFPLVFEPRSINILATGYNGKDQQGVFVWKEYEKMTGVNVNWTSVTRQTRAELVHSALTNGQKLDLILRCKLSSANLNKYGQSGLILDLTKDGLLEKNAPNCWAYLHSHPDTMASVMNPDGSIYALPQVNSGAELRVGIKLFVNKLWLEKVGLPLPSTTKEFSDLLTAFKQQDANSNGDTNDEIPFCCSDWASVQQALYGSFGLANRGSLNMTVDADPETGKARLIASCPQYRDFLEYMNGLYADGLIDKSLFTISSDQWLSNIKNDRVGVFAMTNLALIPVDKADNWIAIEQPLTGPNGDKLFSGIRANFHSIGAAAIPATCQDPALVLKWLDYFWTDEGTLFYHLGVEGETYKTLDDGTYDYLPAIYDEMKAKKLSFDDVVSDYSPYPGGSNPTVEIAPYFMGGEMAQIPAHAARALFEFGPEEYWPSFTYTQQETAKREEILTDLNKYCDGKLIDFITGVSPLSEWDEYISRLEQLRAPELLAVYQSAADRYHALTDSLDKAQ